MDKLTKSYRKTQLENVSEPYSEYKKKIKIIAPNGETKWLDIEEAEFVRIKEILTGSI